MSDITPTPHEVDGPAGGPEVEAEALAERLKRLETRSLTAILIALLPMLLLPPLIAHYLSSSKQEIVSREVVLIGDDGRPTARVVSAPDGALEISVIDASTGETKSTLRIGAGTTPRLVLTDPTGATIFSTPIPNSDSDSDSDSDSNSNSNSTPPPSAPSSSSAGE